MRGWTGGVLPPVIGLLVSGSAAIGAERACFHTTSYWNLNLIS